MRRVTIHTASALACAAGLCVAAPMALAQNQANPGNQSGNQQAQQQTEQQTEQQQAAAADPARAALLEAQQAVRNAETISYAMKCAIHIAMGGSMDVTAKVDMQRNEDTRQWLVRREGKADVPAMGETPFLVINDGGYVKYVDHNNKRVREEIARTTRKHHTLTLADSAWIETLSAREPFADVLSGGESFDLEKNAERIDGVMCNKVTVSMGENRGQQIWWLGADDHLPRKHVLNLGAGMSRTFELSKVEHGHTIDEDRFEIETPEGYEFVTTRRAPVDPTTIDGNFGQTQTQMPRRTMAPNFTLTSADGEEVKLSALRDRVVLLNFWASWSGASKDALNDVQAIHEQFADQPVTVLSLSWRERQPDAPVEEVKSRNHTYTLLTKAEDAARAFGARGFPTFYIIGKDGSIVETITEYDPSTTRAALTRAINQALAGETAAETGGGNQPGGNQQPGTNQPGTTPPGGNQPGGNRPGSNQPDDGNG